jgi:hypothetical protein
LHHENADEPTKLTPFGMTIDSSAQLLKACESMLARRESGSNEAVASRRHDEKLDAPIVVTLLGTTIETSPQQQWKAFGPIARSE